MKKILMSILIISLAVLLLVSGCVDSTIGGAKGGKPGKPSDCTPTEFECSDCIDNDGDGLVDYDVDKKGRVIGDPDCESATDRFETPVAQYCEMIYEKIEASFGAQCGDADYDAVADLDNDKIVDISDFGILAVRVTDNAWCYDAYSNPVDPCESLDCTQYSQSCDYITSNYIDQLRYYDVDIGGMIDLSEALAAINDYLYNSAPEQETCAIQNAWQNDCSFEPCDDMECSYVVEEYLDTLQEYDSDDSKTIDISEFLSAVNKYLYPTPEYDPTKDDVCALKNAWQKGCEYSDAPIAEYCQMIYEKIEVSFGDQCGGENYDPIADLNNDEIVDISDFGILSVHAADNEWCYDAYSNPVDPCETRAKANLKIGGNTYKVMSTEGADINIDDFSVVVDIDANGIMGDESIPVTGKETDTISKGMYFYLWGYGLMRYRGAEKFTSEIPTLRFQDVATGDTLEWSYTNSTPLKTINIGGGSYGIYAAGSIFSDDFDIQVDMSGNGILGDKNEIIVGDEVDPVQRDYYVYLTNYDLVQYKGAEKSSSDNPVMKFKDIKTGETITISYVVS